MPADKASMLQRVQKLRALGLTVDSAAAAAATKPKLSFKLFFPQPPYRGAKYTAALSKTDKLFNFVGLVLGHHGKTIQRVQKASGARVEVHDASGNLNGEHPAHDDPSLHALILADSRPKLDKAVALLLEVLAPTNTTYQPVKVVPGGLAYLRPVIPPHWPEAGEPEPQLLAEEGPLGAQPLQPPQGNAWASARSPLMPPPGSVALSEPGSVAASPPGESLLSRSVPASLAAFQQAREALHGALCPPSPPLHHASADDLVPLMLALSPSQSALHSPLSESFDLGSGAPYGSYLRPSLSAGAFSPAALSPSSALGEGGPHSPVPMPLAVGQYASEEVLSPPVSRPAYSRTTSRDSQRSGISSLSSQSGTAREFSLWGPDAAAPGTSGGSINLAGDGPRTVSFFEELKEAAGTFTPHMPFPTAASVSASAQASAAPSQAGGQPGFQGLDPGPAYRSPQSLGMQAAGHAGGSGHAYGGLGGRPTANAPAPTYSPLSQTSSGSSSLAQALSAHSMGSVPLAGLGPSSLASAGSNSLYTLSPSASYARLAAAAMSGGSLSQDLAVLLNGGQLAQQLESSLQHQLAGAAVAPAQLDAASYLTAAAALSGSGGVPQPSRQQLEHHLQQQLMHHHALTSAANSAAFQSQLEHAQLATHTAQHALSPHQMEHHLCSTLLQGCNLSSAQGS